jgi:hypothetical protein
MAPCRLRPREVTGEGDGHGAGSFPHPAPLPGLESTKDETLCLHNVVSGWITSITIGRR